MGFILQAFGRRLNDNLQCESLNVNILSFEMYEPSRICEQVLFEKVIYTYDKAVNRKLNEGTDDVYLISEFNVKCLHFWLVCF